VQSEQIKPIVGRKSGRPKLRRRRH